MVKIKVNVKTKNDSIPSDTTKRKMPVITNPKIRRTPRRDDRIKREEIPDLLGLSYRKCNEQKIFKRIRKFKDKGVYSKVDAIILKDQMI